MLDDVFNAAVSRYSTGEKARGRDIIAALCTLKEIEGREPTENERASRSYRRAFGSVAAGSLFNFIDGTVDMLPQQARKARDEARLKASQLEGFRARMGQRFEQEDRLDRLQRIRSRLEALLSGTEGEPGEIGRLVAGYEEIRDGADPAPRVEAEPELPAPLVEIAPIPVEPEAAPARPAAEAPGLGKFTEASTQTSLFALVKTPTKAKPVARRRTVERAVQLSLFEDRQLNTASEGMLFRRLSEIQKDRPPSSGPQPAGPARSPQPR